MQKGAHACIEHFQSNNRRAQPSIEKTVGPKWTYLGHPKSFSDKAKGDPYWKICSKHNEIGPNAKKRTNIG